MPSGEFERYPLPRDIVENFDEAESNVRFEIAAAPVAEANLATAQAEFDVAQHNLKEAQKEQQIRENALSSSHQRLARVASEVGKALSNVSELDPVTATTYRILYGDHSIGYGYQEGDYREAARTIFGGLQSVRERLAPAVPVMSIDDNDRHHYLPTDITIATLSPENLVAVTDDQYDRPNRISLRTDLAMQAKATNMFDTTVSDQPFDVSLISTQHGEGRESFMSKVEPASLTLQIGAAAIVERLNNLKDYQQIAAHMALTAADIQIDFVSKDALLTTVRNNLCDLFVLLAMPPQESKVIVREVGRRSHVEQESPSAKDMKRLRPTDIALLMKISGADKSFVRAGVKQRLQTRITHSRTIGDTNDSVAALRQLNATLDEVIG